MKYTRPGQSSGGSSFYPSVIFGLAIYMFLSSAVDLHAYFTHIVNSASIPSIVLRVGTGGVLLWLMRAGKELR